MLGEVFDLNVPTKLLLLVTAATVLPMVLVTLLSFISYKKDGSQILTSYIRVSLVGAIFIFIIFSFNPLLFLAIPLGIALGYVLPRAIKAAGEYPTLS